MLKFEFTENNVKLLIEALENEINESMSGHRNYNIAQELDLKFTLKYLKDKVRK